jgi:hypothetical protein
MFAQTAHGDMYILPGVPVGVRPRRQYIVDQNKFIRMLSTLSGFLFMTL